MESQYFGKTTDSIKSERFSHMVIAIQWITDCNETLA